MPIVGDLLVKHRGASDIFVETGTFLGDGVRKAIDARFPAIYSLEIDAGLVERNRAQFAQHPQVTIVHGDSSKDLGALVAPLAGPITFWLDGHYSSNPLTGYNPEHICPILLELDQIRAMKPFDLGHYDVMSRWPLLIQNPHDTSRDSKFACQVPPCQFGLKLGGRYWRSPSALMSIVPVLSVV